jgi:hypothetical protein
MIDDSMWSTRGIMEKTKTTTHPLIITIKNDREVSPVDSVLVIRLQSQRQNPANQ